MRYGPGKIIPTAAPVADGPRHRVGADVLHVIDVAARIVPSSSKAIAAVAVLVPGLPGREEVLAPVLDPLQGSRQLQRRQHDAHVLALDG